MLGFLKIIIGSTLTWKNELNEDYLHSHVWNVLSGGKKPQKTKMIQIIPVTIGYFILNSKIFCAN